MEKNDKLGRTRGNSDAARDALKDYIFLRRQSQVESDPHKLSFKNPSTMDRYYSIIKRMSENHIEICRNPSSGD